MHDFLCTIYNYHDFMGSLNINTITMSTTFSRTWVFVSPSSLHLLNSIIIKDYLTIWRCQDVQARPFGCDRLDVATWAQGHGSCLCLRSFRRKDVWAREHLGASSIGHKTKNQVNIGIYLISQHAGP